MSSSSSAAAASAAAEIFTYDAGWPAYASAWSTHPNRPFRLALGSFVEDYANRVRIVELAPSSENRSASTLFLRRASLTARSQ
jgi:hypothetical protein